MANGPDYPCATAWYLAAESAGAPLAQGSAVAVRLRRKGKPGTERTYLLTCAHVIRRAGVQPLTFGPQQERIRAWVAGVGFDPDRGIPVRPVASVTPRAVDAEGTFYTRPTANVPNADWALLEFVEPKYGNSTNGIVRGWPLTDPAVGERCIVCGYPDGKGGFAGDDDGNLNHVKPASPYGELIVTSVHDGIIQFQGLETRPGMSGGGDFRKDGFAFVGLHRSRRDEAMQLHAVSGRQILARLTELGYEFVAPPLEPEPPTPPPPIPGRRRGLLAVIALALVGLALWWYWTRPIEVSFVASELMLSKSGAISGRKPLSNATLGLHPANFELSDLNGGTTDQRGNGKFTFKAPATGQRKYGVHFLITATPANLQDRAPWITTVAGAVQEGESLQLLTRKPLQVASGDVIELDAIPRALAPRYYDLQIEEMARDAAAQSGVVSSSVALQFQAVEQAANQLGLSDSLVLTKVRDEAAKRLLERRPSIPVVELSQPDQPAEYRALADKISPSVCYVKSQAVGPNSFAGTGFVVANDLVAVARFSEHDQFGAVGFGTDPSADDPTVRRVAEVLPFPEFRVALLRVPNLGRPPLKLTAESPFIRGREARIAVVGYCAPDSRIPQAVAQQLAIDTATSKRFMPGEFLGEKTGDPADVSTSMKHDATTTGGAAGAPVVDLATGHVVGVHMSGSWDKDRKSNGAAPVWALLKDPAFSQHVSGNVVSGLEIDQARLVNDLRNLVLPALANLRIDMKDVETRHREVQTIKLGPLEKDVVIYFWSVVSLQAKPVDGGKDATLSAEVGEPGPRAISVRLAASVPFAGHVDAKAESDSPRVKLVQVATDFTTTAQAEVSVTLVLDETSPGKVQDVTIGEWSAKLSGTSFKDPLVDKLAPIIQDYLNKRIADEVAKVLGTVEADLKKALLAPSPQEK